MASELSAEAIERLKKSLAAAEPYDDDDPEYNMFDGGADPSRAAAALARDILREIGEI